MKIYQWGQKRFKGRSLGTGCPWDRKKVPSRDKSPKNDSLQPVFEKITPDTFTRPYFLDGPQSECFSIDSQKKDHSADLIPLEIARSFFQHLKNRDHDYWKSFGFLLLGEGELNNVTLFKHCTDNVLVWQLDCRCSVHSQK